MLTLCKYRYWCSTEKKMITIWSESEPTKCINDVSHDIDLESLTITDKLSSDMRIIKSEVEGTYRSETIEINIPVTTAGEIYNHDVSFPHDTYIWNGKFYATNSMVGDYLDIIIGPDTIVGVTTDSSNIGNTIINVSSSVFTNGYTTRGTDITIGDAINKQDLGRITNMDKFNNIITVETALLNNYVAGSMIYMNLKMIRKQIIGGANLNYKYGKKGFSARNVPANSIIRFQYTNNTGTAKTLYFDLEFNYS